MTLSRAIEDRSALVGVVALGYVGLPLIRCFWDAGFAVLGFDTDPDKIECLARGESYLKHLGEDFVAEMAASDRFEATGDLARLAEPDAILICVPTPLDDRRRPDLQFVTRASESVAAVLRPGQLIVLESTTYPGTTRDVVLPLLRDSGLEPGSDFFLAYSPEREDPGRKDTGTSRIPKLVGGIDEQSSALAQALYRSAFQTIVAVSNAEVAEAAKLLENIYRAVNIALVNEMKLILTAMDIDVWEVIDAAATKPFGFSPFYPGPGLGGHCIPIDPFYLTAAAEAVGQPTHFIELAGRINTDMPSQVVGRTADALAQRGVAIEGARVLVLGLAYKPNIDDVRESPSFELITGLRARGAAVDYNDPHVPATRPMRRHDMRMTSVPLDEPTVAGYDCVLIATDHAAYDFRWIADHAKLLIDTRGATRDIGGPRDHIVQA